MTLPPGFLTRWVLLFVVTEAIANGLPDVAFRVSVMHVWTPSMILLGFLSFCGSLVYQMMLGIGQVRLLRPLLPRLSAVSWVALPLVAALVLWFLVPRLLVSLGGTLAVAAVVQEVAIGGIRALLLWRHVRHSEQWLLASAGGAVAAMALGYVADIGLGVADAIVDLMLGLPAGLVPEPGASTVVAVALTVLFWLLRAVLVGGVLAVATGAVLPHLVPRSTSADVVRDDAAEV